MNRTSKLPIVLALIAVVIAILAFFGSHSAAPAPVSTLGGTTNYDQIVISGLDSYTGTTGTLAATDFIQSSISIFPTTGAITLTLPASTTLAAAGFLPKAGDRTSFSIYNASSTAAAQVTLAGGAGTLLTTSTSTKILFPLGVNRIDAVRLPTSDYSFSIYAAQ